MDADPSELTRSRLDAEAHATLDRVVRHGRTRRRSSRTIIIAAAVVATLMAASAISSLLREGNLTGSIIALCFFGPLVLIAIGRLRTQRQSGRFRFINAIVMTRAVRPPADSWVHLAPTRRLGGSTIVAFAWFSLGATAVFIAGFGQLFGVFPKQNEDAGSIELVIAGVLALAAACVGWWVTWLMYSRNARSETVGRRLSGLALGRNGVAVHVPGRDLEVPWTSITSVETKVLDLSRDSSVPMIVISYRVDEGRPDGVQYVPIDTLDVPPDAAFTALRWYWSHPAARTELGRVEARRRLEAWRHAALRAPANG